LVAQIRLVAFKNARVAKAHKLLPSLSPSKQQRNPYIISSPATTPIAQGHSGALAARFGSFDESPVGGSSKNIADSIMSLQ
jgi:hypothetical protein